MKEMVKIKVYFKKSVGVGDIEFFLERFGYEDMTHKEHQVNSLEITFSRVFKVEIVKNELANFIAQLHERFKDSFAYNSEPVVISI